MKVFLTGGTGYIGSAIGAELIRGKHDVTSLVRSSTSAVRVESAGMHALHGDLREPDPWRDAALSADAIVHAGVESDAGRLEADRRVVDALLGPSLIYTSVLFVLGNVEHADESSPARGPRAEHERLVLDAGGTVVRPGMVWGDDAFLFAHPLYIDEGLNRWPLVHRRDMACLYRLVVEQRTRGVFHAVTEVLRARDVFPAISGTSLESARDELGPFADALALDQNVRAMRSREIGWEPGILYSAERAETRP